MWRVLGVKRLRDSIQWQHVATFPLAQRLDGGQSAATCESLSKRQAATVKNSRLGL